MTGEASKDHAEFSKGEMSRGDASGGEIVNRGNRQDAGLGFVGSGSFAMLHAFHCLSFCT
jgi:hypothetical protein